MYICTHCGHENKHIREVCSGCHHSIVQGATPDESTSMGFLMAAIFVTPAVLAIFKLPQILVDSFGMVVSPRFGMSWNAIVITLGIVGAVGFVVGMIVADKMYAGKIRSIRKSNK